MTRALRCAIYTRKSSEEGLDQAFNSLNAQREACEAYILSQKTEGWKYLPTAYDDGGFSGGTMERPALKRLMADVEAGRIDTIVVYKVDRLTRSLGDFARIVAVLDAASASFVSVTQAFNTTTSMGRLTLNVLLSFAQFEREVTGERIRDKIAASKKKGMWMGGNIPFGYDVPTDPATRALVVNPAEAEIVRAIFARYRDEGSVHRLMHWLGDQGCRTRITISRKGHARGGVPFGRGALSHLLKNRHYLGEIVHKTISYPGAHPAIIDPVLFASVQERLAANRRERCIRPVRAGQAILTAILFDGEGKLMSPTFGYAKSKRLYRYYVTSALQRGARASRGDAGHGDDVLRRVSAPVLEDLVRQVLTRFVPSLDTSDATVLRELLIRVDLRREGITLHLLHKALFRNTRSAAQALGTIAARLQDGESAMPSPDETLILVDVPARLCVRGGRTRIIRPQDSNGVAHRADPALVRGLRQAHALVTAAGVHPTRRAPQGKMLAPGNPYHRKLTSLAFLAPSIQRAILEGRQPADLTLQRLLDTNIPLLWDEQIRVLRF
jgi:DNA invertase Pin-like site-specific DNA recombinase